MTKAHELVTWRRSRSTVTRIGIIVLISGWLIVPSGVAVASDPREPGTEEKTGNLTPKQVSILDVSQSSVKKRELLVAQLAADGGDPAAASRLLRLQAEISNPAGLLSGRAPIAIAPVLAAATSPLDWNISQTSQLQSNWCGPAVAYMLSAAWGVTTSRYDSLPLSQSSYSLFQYTNAGASGGTDWIDLDMQTAIDRWLFGSAGTGYVQNTPSSANDLFNKVRTDLNAFWLLPADMVEKFNGPHYNGHPNNTASILHWTLITGYWQASGFGDIILFNDPAFQGVGIGWPVAGPKFWYGKTQAYSQMTGQGSIRGIAW
jgi:hypothetical protein